MASAEHSEGSLEYPRYLGRRLGIASKQVPKLVHGVRRQARFAMETDVTCVLCEPVVKNRDAKGDGAHICGRHGRKSSRLVLFTPWARLPVTLDKPSLSPHPSPDFPTLSTRQSPGRRRHVPRPSQRTSWYSLVPAMEERNIRPCALEPFFQHFSMADIELGDGGALRSRLAPGADSSKRLTAPLCPVTHWAR